MIHGYQVWAYDFPRPNVWTPRTRDATPTVSILVRNDRTHSGRFCRIFPTWMCDDSLLGPLGLGGCPDVSSGGGNRAWLSTIPADYPDWNLVPGH